MLVFRNITLRDAPRLRKYYSSCRYGLCEYSLGVKLMWRKMMHSTFAEVGECLVVKHCIDGRVFFDYPVAIGSGKVEFALSAIDAYCAGLGIVPSFSAVPEEFAASLTLRYSRAQITNLNAWRDYIYDAQDMSTFAGRRYSGQRNHINRFKKLYPDAVFRPLTVEDEPLIDEFWAAYAANFSKATAVARTELCAARELLRRIDKPWFFAAGMLHDGKLISLSLGERCGETLIIHIEKALTSYEGVYPATVRAFAELYGGNARYVNREDDAGDKGLRTSKLQYLPQKMGIKLSLTAKTELSALDEIPTLKTQRLTLDALREEDKHSYGTLCRDDERNRWWGYDYRSDLVGEPTDDYFLQVTRHDFENRAAINFAIRLDGKFIGEAVLYRFDCRGNAELGCRIVPEAAHNGYGAEAFAAVANWAIYELRLAHVFAKCYRENTASERMLSSCMQRFREDDTFFYFEKRV
ncbi:MAG: GNAT family N-acetyltransferase [Oscillospiraceae bacterium]|nr:GNAT family N-acetyltransferase [Oscillospiraceae bacterium]